MAIRFVDLPVIWGLKNRLIAELWALRGDPRLARDRMKTWKWASNYSVFIFKTGRSWAFLGPIEARPRISIALEPELPPPKFPALHAGMGTRSSDSQQNLATDLCLALFSCTANNCQCCRAPNLTWKLESRILTVRAYYTSRSVLIGEYLFRFRLLPIHVTVAEMNMVWNRIVKKMKWLRLDRTDPIHMLAQGTFLFLWLWKIRNWQTFDV